MPLTTLAAWFHDLDPFLWRFSGAVGIRWYGLAYLAGFVVAWCWLVQLSKRGFTPISPQRVGDLMMAMVIGVIGGGRLGYVVFYKAELLWSFTSSLPWWGVLEINRGGMSSHGGMIGVALACIWVGRRWRREDAESGREITVFHLFDLVAATCPVGLMFGRIANFINGELLGRVYAPPGVAAPWWTVKFPQELVSGHDCGRTSAQGDALAALGARLVPEGASSIEAYERMIALVHSHSTPAKAAIVRELSPLLSSRYPSQLFQAMSDGPLLAGTLWLIWMKPRAPGLIGSWFLIAYGCMRMVTEHWRLPDNDIGSPLVFGLSRGQWLSVVMIVGGGAAAYLVSARSRRLGRQPMGGWRRAS